MDRRCRRRRRSRLERKKMQINKIFIDNLLNFGKELGQEVLDIQLDKSNLDIQTKKDESPLSKADLHSNTRIRDFLSKNSEVKNYISEEDKEIAYEDRKDWDYYWLIDPIDGTKEFIKGGNDFCINIALCKKDAPIFGYVCCPALGDQYYAIEGRGAFKNKDRIFCNSADPDSHQLNVVASKSHMNDETKNFVDNLSDSFGVNLINVGSSLKFCMVAEGKADIYPRFGPTMEWDTCAPQIIAQESGADVFVADSLEPLTYNKENLLNPFFIVTNTTIVH